MKREHLIPLEKSKKVIYLDRRGAKVERRPWAAVFFGVLGGVCFLYFLYQLFFVHTGSYFFAAWGLLAGGCWLLACILAHREWMERIPGWFRRSVKLLFGLGMVFFLVVEGLILSQFWAVPEQGADVCIILGAQVKASGPSDVLQRRLDKAIGYLLQNPGTQVIVSGGQGGNEPFSEAQGMQEYLIAKGIEPERIFMEDASTDTWENLDFSAKLTDKGSDSVVIVTNNFHVFRALYIAKKQGYGKVQGLAASTHPSNLANNMLREFFGVIKDVFLEKK